MLLLHSLTAVLIFSAAGALAAHATERWGVFELGLAGPASGNPYRGVQWSAAFTQGDRQVTVPGFWDGDGTFRACFSWPDPAFWRHFEQRILDLQELGIEADLILWHPYDRWDFPSCLPSAEGLVDNMAIFPYLFPA